MTSIQASKSSSSQRHELAKILHRTIGLTILAFLLLGIFRFTKTRAAATVQNSVAVSTVSAASFVGGPAMLASNSIVAAFGTQLATGTQAATTQPLPTTLLNTTVTVGGVAAPLFFVSPGQVNYLIPPNVTAGDAQVVINAVASNGDQIVSRGQVRIAPTAPAVFTANATGLGVPAAVTGRVNAAGQFVFDPNPPFEADPVTPGRVIPSPIDVGTETRPAFLILFGTGLRNAAAGSTRAIIGGIEVPVQAAAAPGFTGLDQINMQIPVALKGRGPVDVSIVSGGISSNPVTVNLAASPNAILSISGFSINDGVVAGQTMTISGSGFSTNVNENIVRFGSAQARVIAATPNQLTLLVPFGAESGRVAIQTPLGETRSTETCRIKTSLSGMVQSTGSAPAAPAPLEGATVRVIGTNLSVRTNRQGAFVVADLPTGFATVEIDGGTTGNTPPFPNPTLRILVQADRDNPASKPVSLQQTTGGSATVGFVSDSQSTLSNQLRQALSAKQLLADKSRQAQASNKSVVISDRGVSLEVPLGTSTKFPDGKTSGAVQVTLVENSRLPGISLPAGVSAAAIAQITPLGVQFSPGASLTFPNPDQANLPPGAKVDLYGFDFQRGSFVKRGTATVSANRAQIVSDGRVVDVASYWFAAVPGNVTTVLGRVINEFGLPVPGAQVAVNGRTGVTDSNGGFTVADVVAAANSQIQAEAVLPRQWASAPRGTSAWTAAVPGGVTKVGTIALGETNVTGLVLSPFVIDFDSADPPRKVDVTLTQPAPAGGLPVALTSRNSAVATLPASVTIPAGQTTVSFNVTRAGAGASIIEAKATVAGNALETFAVVTVSQPAPVLTAVAPAAAAPGAKVTISGTGFSAVTNHNIFGLFRGNLLVWIFDPDDNEILIDATGKISVRLEIPPVGAGATNLRAAVVNRTSGVLSDISAPLNFTVNASNVPTPTLSGVSPGQGKPGDRVTITGGNFGASPLENRVIFRQENVESLARVVQASATQLVVVVPSRGLTRGTASIIASRVSGDGAKSNPSNALDFTITEEAAPPPKPALTSVLNSATQQPSGRDGNTVRAQGSSFGLNFLDLQKNDLANDEPLISLFLFYQNNQYINFTLPTGAQGGTQLTSIVPTGLAAGPAQVTIITFDLETGFLSEESNAANFTITVSSLRLINEDEPNDSVETATELTYPIIVDGIARVNDPAEFEIRFDNGATEKLHDLFFLELENDTQLTLTLGFLPTGNLDLFLLQKNANGDLVLVASSARTQGIVEQLSRTLKAGEYYIAVGAFSGGSGYLLTVIQGASSFNELAAPGGFDRQYPALVEKVRR